MKKFLLPIVFVLLTVATAAQNFTYNGKKYDWKMVYANYEIITVKVFSLLRDSEHSTPIDYPLTIYLSKQGEVAITAKDYSVEYQMNPSEIVTDGPGLFWIPGAYPHVSISKKGRGYVSPPQDIFDMLINTLIDNKEEIAGNDFQSQDQFDEIKAWFAGQESSKPVAKSEPVEETGEIFDIVEVLAQFPGGYAACQGWIEQNLKYPAIAREEEITGRVIVQFIVNVSGALVDVEVLKSPDPSLSKEALRLVQAMPSWQPAKIDGKPVRSHVQIPIKFSL